MSGEQVIEIPPPAPSGMEDLIRGAIYRVCSYGWVTKIIDPTTSRTAYLISPSMYERLIKAYREDEDQ